MLKKFDKREMILQAPIEIFSKSSFHDSSISHIARKASVAEGVLLLAVLYLNLSLARSLNPKKRNEFGGRL
jgi:hypothetical protein